MKKLMKSGLTWALALCIVFSLLPAAAFAGGDDGELSIAGGESGTDYSVSGSTISILTDKEMTVSGTTALEHIVIGNYVTANLNFNGVSIDMTNASPVSVEAGGTLNLTLTGGNTLRGYRHSSGSSDHFPAILVQSGATLSISGFGSLEAIAEYDDNGVAAPAYCYAIGAPSTSSNGTITCGSITIAQATVIAKAKSGIGGVGADITISDGADVSLTNTDTIGIGGNSTDGDPYTSDTSDPASVAISGESTVVRAVMAANSSEDYEGKMSTGIAIGGEDCIISITGGTVTAVGAQAGIGGNGCVVNIDGGTITATGTDQTGIGGEDCTVSISGEDTVVKAYGENVGIGTDYYVQNNTSGAFDITISGGDVTAWSSCTFGTAANDWAATYNGGYVSSSYWGIGGNAGCDAVRSIEISGGTVDARGYRGGIGSSCDTNIHDDYEPHPVPNGSLSILISGGTVNAVAGDSYDSGGGIGGHLHYNDTRSIIITGDAVVGAWSGWNESSGYRGHSSIGGGDNSNATITIKGNAQIKAASVIGSTIDASDTVDNTSTGYAGGTIEILENASIGGSEYDETVDHIGGSHWDIYDSTSFSGGAGGDITINTTGTIKASSIGGGSSGKNGGDGGNITIESGNVFTYHIGGGDGRGYDYSTGAGTGIGGNGGTITISGGTVGEYSGGGMTPSGSTNKIASYNLYYSAPGIGGGGGTQMGGNGGTINVSGGKVYAMSGVTVYDPSTGDTVSEGGSGTGIGGAGIGGGNCADGGIINISGGYVDVSTASINPYGAASATAVPALIGGGSAGGAGQITISGGYVNSSISPHNTPVYGGDATSIGQGKGAIDADGFVKITGGTFYTSPNVYENPNEGTNPVAQPRPWPTAADGSSPVYMAYLSFYGAENVPSGLNLSDCPIVSMILKNKSTGQIYNYGTKDMISLGYLWLPVGDTSGWDGYQPELYTIELKVQKDNTVYAFDGTVTYQTNSNIIGGITGSTNLTYRGEVIETLQLTSDWGNQTKTYNGTDQKPAFTVKNMDGDVLTKDVDYTLEIKNTPNNGTGTPVTVTEMKNSGGYIVTATGKDGTDYEDMTATLDEFWINPKHINASYSGGSFTKEYDGTTDVYQGGTEVTSLAMTVNSEDFCAGDELTSIVAENPRYASSNVGNSIDITTNSPSYTYMQNGTPCNIFNYSIDLPTITGDITVRIIGETNLNASGVTVTKVYDGTDNCSLANVSGNVVLEDLVGSEVATVTITGVSAFNSAQAGTELTVTLTIGDLSGVNAENYTLAGGATSVDVAGSITVADYTYNLTEAQQAQEFTQGGGLSEINLPAAANGVNGETVSGEVTIWHDEACTTQQATNTTVNALTIGSHYLYVKFVPNASETNYDTTKVTTGKVVVLTVVVGDPQELSFDTSNAVSKTYGDIAFTNTATNNSAGGGAITYSSSNTAVAEVDATTGEVTIKGAGNASITATAAEVEGQYRETSINYSLTVSKKPITVTANDTSRSFGETNPAFSISIPDEMLVSGDDENDLDVTLSTTATIASSVGNYDITGTSGSANYDVTVTSGTLTVSKASAPAVSGVNKSLLFSEVHNDVTVNITGLPTDCGTTSFTAGSATGDTEIINGDVTNLSTGIKFSTNSGDENSTATIPVTVTMQNYEDVIIKVTVTLVGKTPVTITGVSVTNKTYDGSVISHSGTPTNEQGYSGTYEYIWSSGSAPKNAGNHTLTVKIPDDNYEFMGEVEIQFIIAQKALTAKPQSISIYNGDSLPGTFTLVFEGIVAGDTITPSATAAYALKNGGAALTDSNTNGTYTIEWTNKDDVALEHTNYLISKADGTLTISTRPSSGGGGGSFIPAPPPAETDSSVSTNNGVSTAAVETQVSTSNGTTTASVNSAAMKAAADAAKAAAEKGKTIAAVEIKANTPANADKVEFSIPKEALGVFSDSKSEMLSLVSGIGKLDINAQTAASIAKQAGGSNINMSVAQVDTRKALNSKQQAAVADDPVYDISITSGGKYISSFDGGSITISLPYELKPGDDPSGVVVWYLDAQGNLQKVESSYDAKTGNVTFTTNHLSLYAVGYDESVLWTNPFADVSEAAWYYDAVRFVNYQKIMEGTSDKAFSPDLTTSRGMLVTILYRMEGSPAAGSAAFTDISGGEWYADAVAWAASNNIVKGYGDEFGPKDTLTREQMAVILMNYAKFKGYKTNISSSDLSDFSDAAAVSSWASEAMKWAVSNGLIAGKSGRLEPEGSAVRSQAATILMRFYELLKK